MSRKAARCTEADVKRALKAAKACGLSMAVEILTDGTIRLVPVDKAERLTPVEHVEVL